MQVPSIRVNSERAPRQQSRRTRSRRVLSRHAAPCLSDSDDLDKACQGGEIIAVAGVEIEVVGMSRGGDEQVCKPAAGSASRLDDRGDDESVASGGCTAEGKRLK